MRNLLLIYILLILTGCNTQHKEQNAISEDDIRQAKLAFSELKEASKKDNSQLWKYQLYGPTILVNPENRTIISNEGDNNGVFTKYGDVHVGILPDTISVGHTAFDWLGKRWTMYTIPFTFTSKEEMLNHLIHESFHRIQPFIGFDSFGEIQNVHLDSYIGRVYLKLELEALKNALHSENPELHLKNAILFRLCRYKLIPEAKQAENSLEINEGLAEYTGSILSGRKASSLLDHYSKEINILLEKTSFVRIFAYYTIPVYGYFMRKSDPFWNQKINKKTNLTDFIADFLNVTYSVLDTIHITQLAKGYNVDVILAYEEEREKKRKEETSKFKSQFLVDNVLIIELVNMNIAFKSSDFVPLDSIGTVYTDCRIVDNWGILEVDTGRTLISSDWKTLMLTYPEIHNDSLIFGNGWKLMLNTGWILEKDAKKYKLIKK